MKGNDFERSIAKKFTEWWGTPFKKMPASGGLNWASEWHFAGDVLTNDEHFPFIVECKKHEEWSGLHVVFSADSCFWKWWDQAAEKAAEEEGKEPLLIFAKNRHPVMVAMEWDSFMRGGSKITKMIWTSREEGVIIIICLLDDLLTKTAPESWRKK